MSGNSSSGGEDMDPHAAHAMMSINKLFPALLECFGIILCGYIAGRANIITSTQAKGLGNFVSKFALPALLFKNMVELDFGDVIWPFLWSVLIAKVSVFCIVCVLTLFVASPASRFSKAGLYSIFATQSNDFALGYPIGKYCTPSPNRLVCVCPILRLFPQQCIFISVCSSALGTRCAAFSASIRRLFGEVS